MFSSCETFHSTNMPHHVKVMSSGTPVKKQKHEKALMQTYQLQETKTFNVVLLIPCTFFFY